MSTRRDVLKQFGGVVIGGAGASVMADGAAADPVLDQLGYSAVKEGYRNFAEADVTSDGNYAVICHRPPESADDQGGTYLVDIGDRGSPENPVTRHYSPLETEQQFSLRTNDVKCCSRDGLYYKSMEGAGGIGGGGVEIVDFGYETGSLDDPYCIAQIVDDPETEEREGAGPTHNVFPHPEEPILYSVNLFSGVTGDHGFDMWNVSDPFEPEKIGSAGPPGRLHDLVVDPDRNRMHAAYKAEHVNGYVIFDATDPYNPEKIGEFSYDDRPGYTEIGDPGFEECHYVDYFPDQGLTVVGDEVFDVANGEPAHPGDGIPGGKHVFDIGWKNGSPENPVHIGFTHSPDAERQDTPREIGSWTGHNFDIIPQDAGIIPDRCGDDRQFLASGDRADGIELYDFTDPTDPAPVAGIDTTRSWTAVYNDEQEIIVGAARHGLYTLTLS